MMLRQVSRHLPQRLAGYLLTLWIVLTVNFLLPRLLPGDPLAALLDPQNSDYVFDAEVRATLEVYYGLDRPLPEQYARYLTGAVTGDLGRSIRLNQPVGELIASHLPWTLLLTLTALGLASLLGVWGGAAAAWKRGSFTDRALARTSRYWAVKLTAPFAGLGLAMLAHAVHNLGVSFPDLCWPCLFALLSDWGGVLILLVVIVWATVREQRWIATYLADEVERGMLSQKNYKVISSYFEREIERVGAFLGGDFRRWWGLGRYYRLATELAFNKRRLVRFPQERDTLERIVRLRRQTAELGQRLG
jgi:hypothetical protein